MAMLAREEPWLRCTLQEIPAVTRAVLHALEMAREDVMASCEDMTGAELFARPDGLTPLSFHLRHIAGSLDRLLTYAEGAQLSDTQKAASRAELEDGGSPKAVLAAFLQGLLDAEQRVRALADTDLEQPRKVGRKELPTSVGGLLVHCADHTSRHVGQVVTTAKLIRNRRETNH